MLKKALSFMVMITTLLSCSSKKNILYFQDVSYNKPIEIKYNPSTIQPNDILSVVISDLHPEAALIYNQQNSNKGQTVNNIEILKLQGYLVEESGKIILPVIGEINTKGKTIETLKIFIKRKLKDEGYLNNPIVNIRLLNAKVTVLGEVKRPGTYSFTERTLSIPQVIGLAGDLTINALRNDIKIIRDVDGKREVLRVDIRTSDWITKEIYYVRPNDIIIISPNSARVKSAGYIGNISGLVGVISLLISTAVLLTR